jgi:hypothetical protein
MFCRKVDSLPGQKIPEWVIIELQGDLDTDGGSLAGQDIGTLHLAAATTSPRKSSAYEDMDSSFRGEVGQNIFKNSSCFSIFFLIFSL